jgi:hypothetical protein
MTMARGLLGSAVLGGVIAVSAGCSGATLMPSLDEEVRGSLAFMVENAQDEL